MQRRDETWKVLVLREHDSIWAPQAKPSVLAAAEALHTGLARMGYQVTPLQIESPRDLPDALRPFDPRACVIFNWYEGVEPNAVDAVAVAAKLDDLNFTYTGSGALTLQVTQDKTRVEHVLCAHAIPTPAWLSLTRDDLSNWQHYPAIVKTASDHGSENLTAASVVYDEQELRAQVARLRDGGVQHLLVSEFIAGREFTVALWGNGAVESLPLIEVDYSNLPSAYPRVKTYAAKWDATSAPYQQIQLVRASNLASELRERIERIARETCRAFCLRDYGRIDLRLRGDVPLVIDVNANPDLGTDSSFFAAAQCAGYDYAAMLDRIVRLAIERAERSARRR